MRLLAAALTRSLATAALTCSLATAALAGDEGPGTAPTPITLPKPAPPPAVPGKGAAFDVKTWLTGFELARDCEAEANRMKAQNPDAAWMALRGCVEKQKFLRGPFVALGTLSDHWADELAARPDAPRVVARMIANRGGDVSGDLPTLQQVRAPVFTLSAAISQPGVYKGRYVVMRATVKDIKAEGNEPPVFTLAEMSMRQSDSIRQDNVYISSTNSGASHQESGQLDAKYNTTNYGSGSGQLKAQTSGSRQGHSETVTGAGKRVYQNVLHETGLVALGKMAQVDPFLQPGNQFVVLARFDGTKASSEGQPLALVSIVAYFQPAALVVE